MKRIIAAVTLTLASFSVGVLDGLLSELQA